MDIEDICPENWCEILKISGIQTQGGGGGERIMTPLPRLDRVNEHLRLKIP